jgi:hypothetical protein
LQEWLETKAAPAHNQWFHNIHMELRDVVMKQAVIYKQEEVDLLEQALKTESWGPLFLRSGKSCLQQITHKPKASSPQTPSYPRRRVF